MRYCVSGRQDKKTLLLADEIKVYWEDRDIINDFIEDYPDKTIILEVPEVFLLEDYWDTLSVFNEKFNENFYLCLKSLKDAEECFLHGIKFYWYYPVSTYYELKGLQKLNVSQVLLNPPLSFDLKNIKRLGVSIRLILNQGYDSYIPRDNGILGNWVRPEDISAYDDYVASAEFVADSLKMERTLLKIYKEDKNWPGNLNLIVKNLQKNVDNRVFPEDFGRIRTTCGQRCQSNGTCHYCSRVFSYLENLEDFHYLRKKDLN